MIFSYVITRIKPLMAHVVVDYFVTLCMCVHVFGMWFLFPFFHLMTLYNVIFRNAF